MEYFIRSVMNNGECLTIRGDSIDDLGRNIDAISATNAVDPALISRCKKIFGRIKNQEPEPEKPEGFRAWQNKIS